MTKTSINWQVTPEDLALIDSIVIRAVEYSNSHNIEYFPLAVYMDIAATHLNGMPLDLAALLAFDDANFFHDIFGIRRHIDRTTGKLKDCFVPRSAK